MSNQLVGLRASANYQESAFYRLSDGGPTGLRWGLVCRQPDRREKYQQADPGGFRSEFYWSQDAALDLGWVGVCRIDAPRRRETRFADRQSFGTNARLLLGPNRVPGPFRLSAATT